MNNRRTNNIRSLLGITISIPICLVISWILTRIKSNSLLDVIIGFLEMLIVSVIIHRFILTRMPRYIPLWLVGVFFNVGMAIPSLWLAGMSFGWSDETRLNGITAILFPFWLLGPILIEMHDSWSQDDKPEFIIRDPK